MILSSWTSVYCITQTWYFSESCSSWKKLLFSFVFSLHWWGEVGHAVSLTRDRRPSTTAWPACRAMGTKECTLRKQIFCVLGSQGRTKIPLICTLWVPIYPTSIRGSQRDVVYLCWPIAPSYMSPNAGGGGCGVSANEYSCAHGAQIHFGDLTLI